MVSQADFCMALSSVASRNPQGIMGSRIYFVYGQKPWVDDNPLTPDEGYFTNMDAVVQIARQNNLVISMTMFHQRYRKFITLQNAPFLVSAKPRAQPGKATKGRGPELRFLRLLLFEEVVGLDWPAPAGQRSRCRPGCQPGSRFRSGAAPLEGRAARGRALGGPLPITGLRFLGNFWIAFGAARSYKDSCCLHEPLTGFGFSQRPAREKRPGKTAMDRQLPNWQGRGESFGTFARPTSTIFLRLHNLPAAVSWR
jgi:hypothetical protein